MLAQWPVFLAWILSVVVVGIYWANHHHMSALYSGTNHLFVLINVLFLMTVSFLPYPTEVLGQSLQLGGDQRSTAVFIYSLGLLGPAATWSMVWFYARYAGLVDARLDPSFVRSLSWRYGLSNLPFLGAAALALFEWRLSLVLIVAITTVYLLPPPQPRYLAQEES